MGIQKIAQALELDLPAVREYTGQDNCLLDPALSSEEASHHAQKPRIAESHLEAATSYRFGDNFRPKHA